MSPLFERLLAEIAEQPAAVERLAQRDDLIPPMLVDQIAAAPAVVLVARGSSDHAAIYGRYLLETRNRLLTSLAAPSTVTLYESGPRLARAVVIAVSQSGQGEDVVAYLREAGQHGATTVAIVNDAASPLAHTAQYVLPCDAGQERSIPATKTVLAQMTVFAKLSLALREEQGVFAGMPDALQRAIAARPQAVEIARGLAKAAAVSVIGRGLAFPVALEVALKLKETSDTRAESFSAADFRHGPMALLDEEHPALLIDAGGRTTAPALDTAQLAVNRAAPAYLLRVRPKNARPTEDVPTLELSADVHEMLAPLVAVVLGQQLAIEVALAKGLDPAAPRGLCKVTSTR